MAAQSTPKKTIEKATSYLYEGQEQKKKVKQVITSINTKNSKTALMAEINSLAEILTVLQTEVSSSCIQFINDSEIKSVKDATLVSLTEKASIRNIDIQAIQYLQKNPANSELESLVKQSLAARAALSNSSSKELLDNYLGLFEKMKSKYQIENEIENLLSKLKLQQQDSKENTTLEIKWQDANDENQNTSLLCESESSFDIASSSEPSLEPPIEEIAQNEIIINTSEIINSEDKEQEISPLSTSSSEINIAEYLLTNEVEIVEVPPQEIAKMSQKEDTEITQKGTQKHKTSEISYKESSKFTTFPRFFGKTGEKYAKFVESLSSHKYDKVDLNTLGNIEYNSHKHYFQRSAKSINFAKEFFVKFFSDVENVQATINYHHNNYKKSPNPVTPKFPACISFISIRINSKEYCLMSTSIDDRLSYFSLLKNFTDNFNRSHVSSVEFVLLGGRISYFHDIFRAILGESYDKKHCAEKFYTKALTKLFLENGRSLRIIDVCNVMLYPYKKHAFYGDRPGALDSTVRPPMSREMRIKISDEIYIGLTVNCIPCQNNKTAVFEILKHAQEMGEEAKQKNSHRRELSPLRNSIKTRSSLFLSNNLDNGDEEMRTPRY